MNPSSDIETAAAEWLVRRDRGGETPEQRQAFEHWLAADSRHRRAYLELEQGWRRADALRTWVPHQGRVNPGILKEYASAAPGRGWRAYAIAATIVVMVAAGGLYLSGLRLPVTYATQVGGYQRVVLPDGSSLQLNTNSKVRVRFGDARREIMLLRGEAYFKVAGDAARPFQVIAADRMVRVLGTAFTVRMLDKDALEVMVTEGKVSVPDRTGASSPRILSAHQVAHTTASATAVRTLSEAEVGRRLAWQTGGLSFQGESLRQVIAEFNRYNRRQLVLADASLAQLQVGGDFQAADLDSFIAALQSSFAVRAEAGRDAIRLFARTE